MSTLPGRPSQEAVAVDREIQVGKSRCLGFAAVSVIRRFVMEPPSSLPHGTIASHTCHNEC
jgi:hypothetical protein